MINAIIALEITWTIDRNFTARCLRWRRKERKKERERERERRKGLAQVGSWFHWGDKRPIMVWNDSPNFWHVFFLFLPQTGHVRTSTGSYIIKPAKPWREDSLEFSLEHAVQRIKPYTLMDPDGSTNSVDGRVGTHNCGVIGELVIIHTFE